MEDYVSLAVPYTNERLVAAAANNPVYLALKTPRDPYVLEALRRVDRREFLPDVPFELSDVDIEAFVTMENAQRRMRELREYQVALPGIEKKLASLSADFSKAVTDLMNSGIRKFVVSSAALAYNDMPLPIGFSQSCSKPSLVAFMNDVARFQSGQNVLEIGTGRGYHAAVTREQLGKEASLTTVEIRQELAEEGRKNLSRYSNVRAVHGDGKAGFLENAPYNRIYLTAGVKIEDFDPEIFYGQLRREDGLFLYPEPHAFNLSGFKDGVFWQERISMSLRFNPLI